MSRISLHVSVSLLVTGHPLSFGICLFEILRREHQVDEEVSETGRSLELVELIPWQVNLVELLVLRDEFLLLRADDLALLSKLVAHEILQLLPQIDLLGGSEVHAFITALRLAVVFRVISVGIVLFFVVNEAWLLLMWHHLRVTDRVVLVLWCIQTCEVELFGRLFLMMEILFQDDGKPGSLFFSFFFNFLLLLDFGRVPQDSGLIFRVHQELLVLLSLQILFRYFLEFREMDRRLVIVFSLYALHARQELVNVWIQVL